MTAATRDPKLKDAILKYIAALHRLRDAQYSNDIANMFARTRDALETLHSEFEIMKLRPPSAFLGRVAIILVAGTEGPAAIAAGIGSAGASIAVGGREVVNLWKERSQLAALDENASDRNRMKVEFTRRLDNLQQEHEPLVWAARSSAARNAPATCPQ